MPAYILQIDSESDLSKFFDLSKPYGIYLATLFRGFDTFELLPHYYKDATGKIYQEFYCYGGHAATRLIITDVMTRGLLNVMSMITGVDLEAFSELVRVPANEKPSIDVAVDSSTTLDLLEARDRASFVSYVALNRAGKDFEKELRNLQVFHSWLMKQVMIITILDDSRQRDLAEIHDDINLGVSGVYFEGTKQDGTKLKFALNKTYKTDKES